jgi:chromosome segregation protein
MYLSKLELHGFKSFADRTVVHFAPGVTVVVGPNGCGKSNIVDAVRWVIGEQRARILRSEKMDNVIFNGAGHRKALGVAEVMLTIENNRGILPIEYSEVTIGRRLYRSGDSEYLLNGTQCRLKDITDLFMDTGMGAGAYSVIELKMIEELLSENEQDRRKLFEEAAGITKYKIRRSQTLRKLDGTQVDLTRVRDLADELDRRVRSLERQAKKASRYKKHRSRLETLELSLAQSEFDRLTDERQSLAAGKATLGDQLEEDGAKLAGCEAEHQAVRTQHIEREQILVAIQTRLSAHIEKLHAAQSDERLVLERLAVASRDIEHLSGEQKTAETRTEMLTESLESVQASALSARPASEATEEALDEARKKRDEAVAAVDVHRRRVHSARQEERSSADSLAELRRSLDRSTSRVELMQEELGELQKSELGLRDSASAAARNADASQDALELAQASVAVAREAVEKAVAEKEERSLQVAALRETVRVAERRMDAAHAEIGLLESLLASFDDFSESIQFLAGDREWADQELVTVADVISCDSHAQQAVEAALGEYAACLVVATEAEAHRAIGKLRDSEKGRATFIVLNRLPEVERARSPDPAAVSLLEFIRTEPEYAGLAEVLLHDTFLVDSLDEALRVAGGEGRFIARTGEWVTTGGVVCGGSDSSGVSTGAGRIGRREQLEEARKTHAAAEQEVTECRESLRLACVALEEVALTDAERVLREQLALASAALATQTRAALERDNTARRIQEIDRRRTDLSEGLASFREDIAARQLAVQDAGLAVQESEQKRAKEEESFQVLEADGRRAVGLFSEAKVTAVQARNQLDNLLRDLSRVEEEIVRIEQEQFTRSERLERLTTQQTEATERIAFLESTIDALFGDRAVIEQEALAAKDALSEIKVAIADLEGQLRILRRTREEHIQEANQIEVRLADIDARSENLVVTTLEDYEVDLGQTRIEAPEDFELEAAKTEVMELRTRIRNLGPVNELALETFEEEQERLVFMQTQLKDLEGAEATLLETIAEINTTACERFESTFAAIQANFSQLFSNLFGEDASASVVLERPDDPLESNIEIFAKPQGKKPSVLAQLSGGEKTLTAIALLFSIYLVKPSPFCILDEVDAPLDDANVDRFMELIRSFAESTQFVLVTHNKRTMEAADRMYGITMQQQGVSRLVGVEFDAEEMHLVA